MTEAAFDCIVVGAVPVEETLIGRAVHHIFSWRILALHPFVLLQAGPVHEVFARLQSWLHGDAGEQVVILRHQRALHLRLVGQAWSVEVECAVAHHCLPFLGLVLVITHNLEHFRVLAPGRSSSRVIAGLTLVHV